MQRARRGTALRSATALALAAALAAACADAPGASRSASEDVCDREPVLGAGFDAYGGWKGASAAASGRFQIAEIDGVWWLVSPDGNGIFSNGVTGIDPEGDVTRDGRQPYGENVLARHGSVEAWAASTLERLCDLGVATLAAWTNSAVHLFSGKRPYPVSLSFHDTAPEVPGWPVGLTGRHLRDLFDPSWPEAALRFARESEPLQACAADPWCYGAFVDNELPWGATTLSVGTHLDAYLTLPAGAPGKVALQRFFEDRYGGDVGALNAAWALELRSFEQIQELGRATGCPLVEPIGDDGCLKAEPAQRRADRMAFEAAVAGRYAEVMSAAFDEAAPGVLNLGVRLFSIYTHPDVARAIAPHVDVMSLNDYDYGAVERPILVSLSGGAEFGYLFGSDSFGDLATLHRITGKPLLIGEWFYRVTRTDGAGPALPPLFPEVATHEEQAAAYRAYAERMIDLPFVVGHHWFQWMDQPREGRRDGENQWIGVVDIEDEPREHLAAAMREVNGRLVVRRAALRNADGG
ncbi:MAG: hypothetical protein AB1689_09130 [Thermodesulfobacteriota bacterium]